GGQRRQRQSAPGGGAERQLQRAGGGEQEHRRGIAERRAAGDAEDLGRGHRVGGQPLQQRARSGQQRAGGEGGEDRGGAQRQEGRAQLGANPAPALRPPRAEQGEGGKGQHQGRQHRQHRRRAAGAAGQAVAGLGPLRHMGGHPGQQPQGQRPAD